MIVAIMEATVLALSWGIELLEVKSTLERKVDAKLGCRQRRRFMTQHEIFRIGPEMEPEQTHFREKP